MGEMVGVLGWTQHAENVRKPLSSADFDRRLSYAVFMRELIARASEAIRGADALLVTAGAGMGVDSGLPDFRGVEGFWNAYPAYRHLGLNFAQLANPQWFERDPELAWGFYGHRLAMYRQAVPHPGFGILRKWGGRMAGGLGVFTSNVDGQFQEAGFGEDTVMEVHGSIHHLQCVRGCRRIWPAEGVSVQVDPGTFRAVGELPRCEGCGGLARPNVLMFGDMDWLAERTGAQEERLETWLEKMSRRKLVVVECGAGTAVPSVRLFSSYIAERYDATLIRINKREPKVDEWGIGIAAGALEALTAIDREMERKEG
jgi:NAD-dependent SIR2 family protein deacetylase